MIKAIETQYQGYRFRSRLEAKWAVFFDALGVKWEYEIEGYDMGELGKYLPDFYLPDLGCYAEVKPSQFTETQWAKCEALPEPCLLLDGVPGHKGWFITQYMAETDGGCSPSLDSYEQYVSGDEFGRVNLDWSAHKGRIWYLYGESIDTYESPDEAISAARGARFEHGENGARRHR